MIEVDMQAVSLLAGTVVPLLVALVAKLGAKSSLKAALNLGISILSGVLAVFATNSGTATWEEIVTACVTVFLASGVSYQNLLKPTGVAERVAVSTYGLGLGSNDELLQYEADRQEEKAADALNSELELLEWETAAEGAAAPPQPDEERRVTTLKGVPVYRDDAGYLFAGEE